jgi:hypothetical protein
VSPGDGLTPTSGALLSALDPKARDDLRHVLIRDQDDRDAVSSQLLRYRDGRGDDWADIIDMLTIASEGAAASSEIAG